MHTHVSRGWSWAPEITHTQLRRACKREADGEKKNLFRVFFTRSREIENFQFSFNFDIGELQLPKKPVA